MPAGPRHPGEAAPHFPKHVRNVDPYGTLMSRSARSGHATCANSLLGHRVVTALALAAACQLPAGCTPTDQPAHTSAAGSPGGAAPAAQPTPAAAGAAGAAGGSWEGGRNSDDYTIIWDDGLGQYVELVCGTDEPHAYLRVKLAKPVAGPPTAGRLHVGDPATPGNGTTYAGPVSREAPLKDTIYGFALPSIVDLPIVLDGATRLTVEVGDARVSFGRPPAPLLQEMRTECAPRAGRDTAAAAPTVPAPPAAAPRPAAASPR